jgi:hypothetical protein
MTRKHTPGPWRRGLSGGIVADSPVDGGVANDDDNLRAYGGYLIAETIAECNRELIAAAPDLLMACEAVMADCPEKLGNVALVLLRSALAKARGET